MRGAGCSWNDILDQDLDRKVLRTRSRPLARGAVSSLAAFIYTGLQLLVFFGLQTQLPTRESKMNSTSCVYHSIPFILATGLYPLTKRITNYPQVFLSVPASWGLIVAFPALGLDVPSSPESMIAAGSLCLSNIAWTILSDTIYAFQDLKDDKRTGIKSLAVKHEKNAKSILYVLSIVQIGCLVITGVFTEVGLLYFTFLSLATATLGTMIYRVNLGRSGDCAWWFKHGCLVIGGSIASGLLSEYTYRAIASI